MLLEQQQRLHQQAAAEANLANIELPTPPNPRNAPNAQGRRPASDSSSAEFRDWANRYRDLDGQSDSKSGGDSLQSRQRAASLRQARELKALEAELAGSAADTSQNASSAPQSQPAQPPAPQSSNQFRSPNHYFATQGSATSRPAGVGGSLANKPSR